MTPRVPCIVYEDDDLLVANKPPGLNTHSPSPLHGEGIYEWFRNHDPRWASLAIIHRLDKETSGLIVFGRTARANQSLTAQFTERSVFKEYVFVTDRPVKKKQFSIASSISRAGNRYLSTPRADPATRAETEFRVLQQNGRQTILAAMPKTGRTHQIRVHAAALGFPILGDEVYGGSPAARLHLHARKLVIHHPLDNRVLPFEVESRFDVEARVLLRESFIDVRDTSAWRIIHGAADGQPELYLERLGEYALAQTERLPTAAELNAWKSFVPEGVKGFYHKPLRRRIAGQTQDLSPRLISGAEAPTEFEVIENGVKYRLSFREGYSVGLFLDQRENRRRILSNYAGPDFALLPMAHAEVLNMFAYTCAFSVCAAKAGARTTSLDLSRKYLAWGEENFRANGIDPAGHDFIYGDVFEWLKRLQRKNRMFDAIFIDPPTFSKSKESGTFQVEKDLARVVTDSLARLKPGGILFASSNAASWPPEDFIKKMVASVASGRRKLLRQQYVAQPIDFPISRSEPGYFKSLWMKVE